MARLIRTFGGDFALAEEAVQDAFEAALEQWPLSGVPPLPRAWLLRTARNKAIDRLRRRTRFEAPFDESQADAQLSALRAEPDETENPALEDDILRLIFTCCHPAIALEAQVALTLRSLCGLTTDEIARAFLVEPATMAQRLVRAQHKIKVAKIPYAVPERSELAERLEGVLAALYLVFSEGYAATAGDDLVRRELSSEAIRLARLLERLLPERPEPAALLALMLLHDARRAARIDAVGDLVLLEDQDRSLWDHGQIAEGLALMERALSQGPSVYGIQAAVAALHARASRASETDWPQIVLLYEALQRLANTPVIALNHAAAVAMARGPEQGLRLLDQLGERGELEEYHLYHAARADLLRRLGHKPAAAIAYQRALDRVRTLPEQRYLSRRLAEVRCG